MAKKSVGAGSRKSATPVQREFARLAATLRRKQAAEQSIESRRQRGLRKLTEHVGVQGGKVMNELVEFSPELAAFIVDFGYGDVIGRNKLDDRTRALAVVSALAALGTAQPQLQVHIGTALNSGCTKDEIVEVLMLVAVYAGFPAALNGVAAARASIAAAAPKTAGKRHNAQRTT